MDKYINQNAARNALYEADAITMKGVAILNNFPAADVVEVRHGRWIFDDFDGDGWDYQCSECGGYSKGSYDYCYHCGAKMDRWKMDGGQNE